MEEGRKMHIATAETHVWSIRILLSAKHLTTISFYPRKHCHTVEAGLLACNIFAVLPTSRRGGSGQRGQKRLCYLQLRDSL
jgi:hypothetical protein